MAENGATGAGEEESVVGCSGGDVDANAQDDAFSSNGPRKALGKVTGACAECEGVPRWDIGMPSVYKYEEVYRNEHGEVDDTLEKPELENSYCNVPARVMRLRGPGYLENLVTNNLPLKVPSERAAYSCIGLNVFQSTSEMSHAAEKVMPLKRYLEERAEADAKLKGSEAGKSLEGDAPKYLIYCWNFSNFWKTEFHTVVHLCRRVMKISSDGTGEDPVLDRTFSRWLAMSEEEKNKKLKYVAQFTEAGPNLMNTINMLGGQRPVIIGKKLTTTYHGGQNYLEIDLDIGSSTVASMLQGVALKSSGQFVLDECITIEAQEEDELPERALFSIRWNHCTIEACRAQLDDIGNLVS